jgi:hypothetical protein
MCRFIVVKSLTRKYGFALKAPPSITWVTGPQNSCGWYRLKSDAQKRADELNCALGSQANETPLSSE